MQLIFFFLLQEILVISANLYVDIVKHLGHHRRIIIFGCDTKEMVSTSKFLFLNEQGTMLLQTPEAVRNLDSSQRYSFIVNLNCKNSLEMLQEANERRLYSYPFHWFVFYKNVDLSLVPNMFANLSILVDSHFSLSEVPEGQGEIAFRGLFKKNPTSPVTMEVLRWLRDNDSIFSRRKNLGIALNTCLVVTHNDSVNHLTDGRDKHIDSIAKVNYVLVKVLASIYNITLNISITDSWDYKNEVTQRIGLLGELTRKTAEIGGTSLFFIKERVDLIDYIAMISPTRSAFVFREPKLSYVTNVYTLPLATQVWISTLVTIVLMVLTIFALMKWECAEGKRITPQWAMNHAEFHGSFLDATLMTVGALCQQSAAVLPYSNSGRIATLFLFVSLMFIYVSYSANIVALLQTSSDSIRTLEDLLKSRIPVGVDDTVFNHFFFKGATEPIRKKLYETKVAPPGKPPNYMAIEEGVRRLRQGLFAFHMETGSGYKIIGETFREDEKCALQEIPFLQVTDPYLAVQKNSSYKKMLKIGLRLLQETGIQQRENNKIYTKRPVCTSRSSTFVSVGLIDCYPAVAILAGGVGAALAILLLEFLVKYKLHSFGFYYKHT